ncbi:MAG: acyl-CoA dehydrogenase family protein [Anaerolineae bacterium]|nr:acyl-CoA dehydrogenase family protein [Anaerolineae bacterium]
MDFSIPERTQDLVESITAFVEKELFPLEREFLTGTVKDILPKLAEKREKVKELGMWAPFLPEEYGGMGLSLNEFAHVSEALGRSPLGHYTFNCQAPDVGNMEILIEQGTEEQKETFLKTLAAGEIRSCFGMTEPEFAGSNPIHMAASAVKDGDDYVINAHKWFTSSADGTAFCIVMAVTNPDDEKVHQRASQIIVPTDTPGYELVRNMPVMGHRGEDYFSHGEIQLTDCRVPKSNLLGEEGRGFAIAQERLGPGRIHHCMRWIGICERAFDLMCEYAGKRELNPGDALGNRQIVQAWIAESRAEINAARLMVLQAAWKIDKEGAKAARDEISIIKFFVANVLQRVLDRSIQTHGGLGVTDYTPLSHWYRHERAARIYDGPDEVHKSVVARRILKQYGIEINT